MRTHMRSFYWFWKASMSDVFFFLSAQITDKVLLLAAKNTESSTVITVIKVKVFTEKCNVMSRDPLIIVAVELSWLVMLKGALHSEIQSEDWKILPSNTGFETLFCQTVNKFHFFLKLVILTWECMRTDSFKIKPKVWKKEFWCLYIQQFSFQSTEPLLCSWSIKMN